MRVIFLFFVIWGLGGCVSQTYQPPPLSPAKVVRFEEMAFSSAISVRTNRLRRAHQLLWPLLVANVELCPDTRFSVGMIVQDRDGLGRDLDGITASQLAAAGVPAQAYLFAVMVESPAAMAGLQKGDLLIAVNGERIEDASSAQKALSKLLQENDAISLSVQRERVEQTVSVAPIKVCDAKLRVAETDVLNAYAGSDTINMHAGLMRLIDDEGLQFVLAHELAHVALQHTDKLKRNMLVTGGFITIPLMSIGGSVLDEILDAVDKTREVSLAAKAVSTAPHIVAFEAEADYVGLYMVARAGRDLTGASEAFTLFSREKPQSIWMKYTHPVTPERMSAAEATIAEINAKRGAGEALLPTKR